MTSNDKKISNRSCDVLIIGGGSAGLRAAIEAHDAGSQVLIVSRSSLFILI
jgi:succinate dehydrogenase / fumarate reductase, flavoprotein subunit